MIGASRYDTRLRLVLKRSTP
ncbi:hypothetical protein U2I82_00605 [Bacillus subtilis]